MKNQTGPRHVEVNGFANGPFEQLYDIFARMLAAQRGGGAALSIYRDGVPIVDLVGGDYPERPLQLQFSVSKAVTAIASQHASRAGVFDLDAPIATYWPEFDREGTRTITPRLVLSHRAGLPGVDKQLTIDQVIAGEYAHALEVQEPYWEPGTDHGYHLYSFGPLMDGIFTRAVGMSVGEYVAKHLVAPLGLDLWLGTPADIIPQVSPYIREVEILTPAQYAGSKKTDGFVDRGFSELMADMTVFNRPDLLEKDWPVTNVVCGARDLAKLFAATMTEVDGVRVLDAQGLSNMNARQAIGPDWVLGIDMHYGSGTQLPFPQLPYLGSSSFGHEGAGGTMTFADVESGMSFSFATNAYPVSHGASIGALALLPSIRHLLEREG